MATPIDSRALDSPPGGKTFFGHPRGLATLFFTEMCERFSYYGMRALLILFMTAGVDRGRPGFPGRQSRGHLRPLHRHGVSAEPAGRMGCRPHHRTAAGGALWRHPDRLRPVLPHGSRASPRFISGWWCWCWAPGCSSPTSAPSSASSMAPGDHRRDAGFSIFYMGINLGALIAPLACGWVGERIGWRLGFGLAGVGMTGGLIQYVLSGRHLGSAGPLSRAPRAARSGIAGRSGAPRWPESRRWPCSRCSPRWRPPAGSRSRRNHFQRPGRGAGGAYRRHLLLAAAGPRLVGHRAQAFGRHPGSVPVRGGVLVGFRASRFVAQPVRPAEYRPRTLSVFLFPASWFQFVQPFFIVTLAPVFAWLWVELRPREPSSPAKFALGLFCGGLGFAISSCFLPAARGVPAAAWWLVATYLFHSPWRIALEPGGPERHDQTGARAHCRYDDGPMVRLHRNRRLPGRAGGLPLRTVPLPVLFGIVAAVAFAAALALAAVIRPPCGSCRA